jgi:hypothetical protein
MQMENQWAQASKTGNADALAPLLSENFVALDSDGTLRNKAEVLARVRDDFTGPGVRVGRDNSMSRL